MVPVLCVSSGEPAGIGPELMYHLASRDRECAVVVLGSAALIKERCALYGAPLQLRGYDPARVAPAAKGELTVLNLELEVPSRPGCPDPRNSPYVLKMLDRASEGCLKGEFQGLVTAPVSKAAIAACGVPFSGHTEYLQQRAGVSRVVMLLGCRELRVALMTTHLPLRQVPDAITGTLIHEVVQVLSRELKQKFGIPRPRIFAAGLNPHAGEDGHLGREELDIIIPAFESLRAAGLDIRGPYPADTLFQPKYLREADVFLTMYHDQGLPVLKYAGFDHGYNTTLGLPYIRTSVDHGTAFDLAGSGRADPGSLFAAVELAEEMLRAGKLL